MQLGALFFSFLSLYLFKKFCLDLVTLENYLPKDNLIDTNSSLMS